MVKLQKRTPYTMVFSESFCPALTTGGGNPMIGTAIKKAKGKMTLQCAFCQGKGIDPFELLYKQSVCQVCSGGGRVTTRGPARECAYCNGTGVHLHRRLVCTVCGGKGIVNIKEPMETCPQCRGRGLMPGQYLPCLRCKGKGIVISESV